jgi:hypothetical protein
MVRLARPDSTAEIIRLKLRSANAGTNAHF